MPQIFASPQVINIRKKNNFLMVRTNKIARGKPQGKTRLFDKIVGLLVKVRFSFDPSMLAIFTVPNNTKDDEKGREMNRRVRHLNNAIPLIQQESILKLILLGVAKKMWSNNYLTKAQKIKELLDSRADIAVLPYTRLMRRHCPQLVNEPSLASELHGEKRMANRPGISFNSNLDTWSARTAKENICSSVKARVLLGAEIEGRKRSLRSTGQTHGRSGEPIPSS